MSAHDDTRAYERRVMPRYTTLREVYGTVLKRYENETTLNRAKQGAGCFYAPRYNNVGCAIGCLFDFDDAALLDGDNPNIDITAIRAKYPKLYGKYFGDPETDDMINYLLFLQAIHDNSPTLDDFREYVQEQYDRHAK
jgi:hypothetical protein